MLPLRSAQLSLRAYCSSGSMPSFSPTSSRIAADVTRFIDLLLNATRSAPVTVVATVRADFYDPLIGHQEMRSLLPTRQVLLGSMPRSELERTIVEPAKKVGLAFEPASLVQSYSAAPSFSVRGLKAAANARSGSRPGRNDRTFQNR